MRKNRYTQFVTLVLLGTFFAGPVLAEAPADMAPMARAILFQARGEIEGNQIEAAKNTLKNLDGAKLDTGAESEKMFLEAEILWLENKHKEAYGIYAKVKDMPAVDLFSKSEALWKMAEYHNEKKDGVRALAYGRESLKLLPKSSVRTLQMADLSLEHNKNKEAMTYFEKAVALLAEADMEFPADASQILSAILLQARNEIEANRLASAKRMLKKLNGIKLDRNAEGEKMFLEAEILWLEGKREEAYGIYAKVKDMPIDSFSKSEALWKMAEYHNERNDGIRAMAYGRESAELLPDSSERNLQMAYLSLGHNKDREATMYFEKAANSRQPGEEERGILADAAYAYKRLGENEKVLDYLERIIDDHAGRIAAAKTPAQDDIETLYDLRREHADITRKFGANTTLYYEREKDNNNYTWQGMQELYWQPYYGNGAQVQIYAQVVDTLKSKQYLDGSDTLYGVAGVRVEPLAEYNLVLALERVFEIGDETSNDTNARIGYSWDTGLELEPYVTNWQYITFFNEYIYSLEEENSLYYGETRFGRNFRFDRISDRLTVSPHAFFSWNFDDSIDDSSERWNLYVGPGLHFRKWYHEDKYNAPEAYLDIFLQYRFGLNSDSDNSFIMTFSNSF